MFVQFVFDSIFLMCLIQFVEFFILYYSESVVIYLFSLKLLLKIDAAFEIEVKCFSSLFFLFTS